ncbi:MAG: phage/plasmid replication protein [Burkholderiales bacterium]
MSARDTRKPKTNRHEKHAQSSVTRASLTTTSNTKPTATFIDEATFRIPYKGTLPSTRQQVIDVDGVIGFDGHNRLPVPGLHGAGQLFLRTFNRKELWLKCCIGKVVFGHNAAGYTHLPRALKRLLKIAKNYVKGTLDQPWETPERVDIQLDSVSLTRHMRFESEEEASRAVDQIQASCSAHGLLGLVQKAGETYTTTTNRRLYSVTFYVKSKEMRASRNPHAQEILAAVDGFLRVEIRLTPAALRKFNIATVDRWKHGTADRVFSEVFVDFEFMSLRPLEAIPGVDDPKMPMQLQRAVALVRAGVALDSTYAPSSARRLLAQAAEFGLDLRAPPTQGHADAVLLNPANRWVTDVPDEIKRLPGFDKQYGKPRRIDRLRHAFKGAPASQ